MVEGENYIMYQGVLRLVHFRSCVVYHCWAMWLFQHCSDLEAECGHSNWCWEKKKCDLVLHVQKTCEI